MRLKILFIIFVVAIFSCKDGGNSNSEGFSKQLISFHTSDGIEIIGDLYEVDKEGSTILLFHQGASNARGEYSSIIPRLIENGYNILAIDQRVGGQIYGSYNRTLERIPSHSHWDGYGYCDAYNNLEGALDFIVQEGFSGKKILWGSSYSAALAIKLANNRQSDIEGVLAFSPASGNGMQDCQAGVYFKSIKIPLLILRPPNEMEIERVRVQLDSAKKYNHSTYVAKDGIHGSSMLVKERVKADVEENWEAVLAFLGRIESQ